MYKIILTILIFPLTFLSFAQKSDSLFVNLRDDDFAISYKPKPHETIFTVSRRFHIPVATLADANGFAYDQQDLSGRSKIIIPIGDYNRYVITPLNPHEVRPLYYKAQSRDNLRRISQVAQVKQSTIQQWNNMTDVAFTKGQIIFVGWVRYDEWDSEPLATNIPKKDTVKNAKTAIKKVAKVIPKLSEQEQLFLKQTNNGKDTVHLTGSAVFFPKGGGDTTQFYAFHDSTDKGAIIKVHSSGTDKTIFVKVLGAIPTTKQYHGCSIAISSNAKNALGVAENKTWVDITYGIKKDSK